jgi:hypothetical protein
MRRGGDGGLPICAQCPAYQRLCLFLAVSGQDISQGAIALEVWQKLTNYLLRQAKIVWESYKCCGREITCSSPFINS